jgi:hypothetical protein
MFKSLLRPPTSIRQQLHHELKSISLQQRTSLRRPLPRTPTSTIYHSTSDLAKRSIWSYLSSVVSINNDNNNNNNNHKESDKKPDLEGADKPTIDMPPRMMNEQESQITSTSRRGRELQQLLDAPIGSFRAGTWMQAERSLRWIVDQEDIPQAFSLLDRMVSETDSRVHLTDELLYLVVNQWCMVYIKHKRHPLRSRARSVLPPLAIWHKLEAYQRTGIQMNSRIYHRVLEGTALCKSKKPQQGPLLAEAILERMMSYSKSKNPLLRPSTFTFNTVLAAWESVSQTSPEAPQKALDLLQRLKTLYDAGWGRDAMPDRITYRRVMTLFAHKGDGDQVETLLEELYTLYLESGQQFDNLRPTTPFFTLVLYAWSKSKDPHAADRATVILERMLELEENGDIKGFQVNAACFNIVMICWSKQRSDESAVRVQALFDRLVELSLTDPLKRPIGGSYAALISTWSRVDPQKAETVMWQWKEQHDRGMCEMKVDERMFTTLIAGWYHSKFPQAADRCDRLLQHAIHGDLNTFEPTMVSVVAFNMAINAWARKNTWNDMERAEVLLRQVETYGKTINTGLKPSTLTYIPVIHGWANIGQVERSEGLLREWFQKYDAHDIPSAKKEGLDTHTFNKVLKAWLTKASITPEAAARAEDLLLSMSAFGVRPSGSSFQIVLDCRRRSSNTRAGFPKPPPSARAAELVDMLDKFYRDGGRGGESISKESYLTLRNGWTQ